VLRFPPLRQAANRCAPGSENSNDFDFMTNTEEYRTILTELVDRYEIMFIILIHAPFWIKTFINSSIINSRDNTEHFLLLLNPFSSSAREHGLESALRFYWKPVDGDIRQKKLVNYLSLFFAILIAISFINNMVEFWMR
jgi:hypothetical protein